MTYSINLSYAYSKQVLSTIKIYLFIYIYKLKLKHRREIVFAY